MGLRGPKPKRKEAVWSADFAYALGLLTTDGNLSPDGRHLSIISKDIDQIENVRKCLEVTAECKPTIRSRDGKTRTYYRVQWGDIFLYNYLLEIGLTPNKSLTLGAMQVPDEHFFDFLRGHHDGDGSFHSYYDPRWKSSFMFYLSFISASKQHVEWIQETLFRLIGVQGSLNSTRTNKVFQLRYAKAETLKVLERMYENPHATHLERKS